MASRSITASLTGTGSSASFAPMANGGDGRFNVSVSGTFVGTFILRRSFDDGSTWLDTATTGTAPAESQHQDTEHDVLYEVECSAFTSGTLVIRISG